MEIKLATETIPARTVERTIYVASDGVEFDNEYDCKAHEDDRHTQTLLNGFEDIRVPDAYLDEINFAWPLLTEYVTEYSENDMVIVHPRSADDVDILREMFNPALAAGQEFEAGHYYLIIVRDLYDNTTWGWANVHDFYAIWSWAYEVQKSICNLMAYQP